MMPWNVTTMAVAVLVAFLVGAGSGWTVNGWRLGQQIATEHAALEAAKTQAVEEARSTEKAQQQGVNDALRKQNDRLAGINGRLAADLERLRDRPERDPNLPDTARPSCQGANGTELGGFYAEFLTRYASKAAEQDAALEACYAAIDAMNKKGPAP